MQIEPIERAAAEPAPIGRASASSPQLHRVRAVAAVAARARIRRADEHRPRRERHGHAHAAHGDDAVLERLAQRLERGAPELGELVEEEHAVMREAHLAGARVLPAADERDVARRVVRRTKRPLDEACSASRRASPRRRGSR